MSAVYVISNVMTGFVFNINIEAAFHVGIYQVVNLAMTGVLFYGGSLVIDHTLTTGQLSSIIIYSWLVVYAFVGLNLF